MNDENRTALLSERDHAFMTAFLSHLFDGFKSGAITKDVCTGVLAQLITAVDIGNLTEARCLLEEGRSEKRLKLVLAD